MTRLLRSLPLALLLAPLLALPAACGDGDDGPLPDDAGSLDGGGGDTDGGGGDTDGGGGDTDGGGGDTDGGGGDTDGGGGDTDGGPATDAGTDAGPVSMPCTASGDCDPFDTGSCPDGESCRIGTSGTECMSIIDTPLGEDESCATSQDCQPGLLCLDFGDGEGFTCQRMCPDGSIGFCADGEACIGSVGDSCIRICRPIPEECNIYDQDCADPDDTCTFARHPETGAPYTGCRPAGTQDHGEPCGGDSGSCGHGLVCIRTGGETACHHVCRTDGRDPTCTVDGETCSGEARTWGVTYCRMP